MTRWRNLRYLLLLGFVGFAAYAFRPYVQDLSRLYDLRHAVNYYWFAAAVSIQILQYAAEGYFRQTLLGVLRFQVRLWDAARIASLEAFATHIIPIGQLGLFAANAYFYQKLGVDFPALVVMNATIGAAMVLVLLLLFLGALVTVPATSLAVSRSISTPLASWDSSSPVSS